MPNKRDVDAWKKRIAYYLSDETMQFNSDEKRAIGIVMKMFDDYCEKSGVKTPDSPKAESESV